MKHAIAPLGAVAALGLSLAMPARAQDAAPATPSADEDLRCVVVMMDLSQSSNQRRQMEALIGSFYFLGRLDAGAPKLDIGKRVFDESKTMTPEKFTPEASRCEAQLQVRMKTLSDMADELDKKLDAEKPATPPAAPGAAAPATPPPASPPKK